MEIDFLLSNGSKLDFKVIPVEVKSSKNYHKTSFDLFRKRFGKRVGGAVIIHPKNYSYSDDVEKIPPYMVPLMFS